MKKMYSLFATAVLAAAFNAQTTVNYVWASQGLSNTDVITTGNLDSNLSYSALQNTPSTPPTFYTGGGGTLRMYADNSGGDGNSFTITPSTGNTITSLTINAANNYTPPVQYSINGGAYQAAALSGNSYTISGVSAGTSIKFKNAVTGSNTQLRILSLDVVYTAGSLAVADFKKVTGNFVKNTLVKNNEIIFGSDVKDIKVYTLSGAIVKTGDVKNGSTLNVAELAKGNYIVTGIVNNEQVSQKIMKD